MTRLFLGIDGGGTGCRALLANTDGTTIGAGSAGSANIHSDLKLATDNILAATTLALQDAGYNSGAMTELHAVLGLAGANVGEHHLRLVQSLPFAQSHIVTDGAIALEGAHGSADGAIAIVGTGSVFLRRTGEQIHSIGGWGHVVSDLGSGAWLGKRVLQETLLSYEGVTDGSELGNHILNRFNQSPAEIAIFAHAAAPDDFARLAPLVFSFAGHGDQMAVAILQAAVIDIERLLDRVVDHKDMPVCLLGGLGPSYQPFLAPRYQSMLRPARGNAPEGAISICKRIYAIAESRL